MTRKLHPAIGMYAREANEGRLNRREFLALASALEEFRGPRPKSRGIIDVEVDPVEWPS